MLKQVRGSDLVDSVRRVAAGQSLLDPTVTGQVLERLRRRAEAEEGGVHLTDQERRLLDLLAEGLTNRQIGERMYLAEKTVKNYVSNLLMKLGMHRRTEAAVRTPAWPTAASPGPTDGPPIGVSRPGCSSRSTVPRGSPAPGRASRPAAGPGPPCCRAPGRGVLRGGRADPVVADVEEEVAVVRADPDLDVVRLGVAGDVAERLRRVASTSTDQVVGRRGVDRAVEQDGGSAPSVGVSSLTSSRTRLRMPVAPAATAGLEGEDGGADLLDGAVQVVDRRLDPGGARAGSVRISAAAPWSDRPVANSRWMTVSCRSRAIRARSSTSASSCTGRGGGRCRWRRRRRRPGRPPAPRRRR